MKPTVLSADVPTYPGNTRQLILATGAFAVCFAVFGSVSALMPTIRERLGLEPWQVSVAIAVPVLLGSLGRIPLGMLTDRLGARIVFSATMACAIVPAVILGWVESFAGLIVCGFFVGAGLASFSVGVGMVSRWYPPHRQGMALGVYGAGNAGQSLAALGAPLMAGWLGYAWGFWGVSLLTAVWLIVFVIAARDAPRTKPPLTLQQLVKPLAAGKSWVLSAYYFLTFGGFVAMSIYLPTFLTDIFDLSVQDAGARTAGFVLLATAMRPLGGALADRIGGERILMGVFPAVAVLAMLMALPHLVPFTVGALGVAAAIGLGNGAVFKLVPEFFPDSVGSVTGLVGAAGGLGGFFPPLVVGLIHQLSGSYAPGFVLLGLTSGLCFLLLAAQRRRAG
jgi:MFS transporter, NNP family, nitrate/nitrite transporter